MLIYFIAVIRYFSNYFTLHRSDLAPRAAPLDLRLLWISKWSYFTPRIFKGPVVMDIKYFKPLTASLFLSHKTPLDIFNQSLQSQKGPCIVFKISLKYLLLQYQVISILLPHEKSVQ